MPIHTQFSKLKVLIFIALQFQHIQCMYPDEINSGSLGELATDGFKHKSQNIHAPAEHTGEAKSQPLEDESDFHNLEWPKSVSYAESDSFCEKKPQKKHGSPLTREFHLERILQIPQMKNIPKEDFQEVGKFLSTTFPFNRQTTVLNGGKSEIKIPGSDLEFDQKFLSGILKDISDKISTLSKFYPADKYPGVLNLQDLIEILTELHKNDRYSSTQFTEVMKEFFIISDVFFEQLDEHAKTLGEIGVTLSDVGFQMIYFGYQQGKITKEQVKELVTEREDQMARTMVFNYKIKNDNLFSVNHPRKITSYISSQFMHRDWRFSHYKPLVDFLEQRTKKSFWWTAHQVSIDVFYGGNYESKISKDDFFRADTFYPHVQDSMSSLNSDNSYKINDNENSLQKLKEEIKRLKGVFMDQANTNLEERLYSFLDLHTLEMNYPKITQDKSEFNEIYMKNLDSMSFACQLFQDTLNIEKFIPYIYYRSSVNAYGAFSIPTNFEKPKEFTRNIQEATDIFIKYIQITLSVGASKVSENDSIIIKPLFSDPINNLKNDIELIFATHLI